MWDLVGNPEDRFSHNEAYFHRRAIVMEYYVLQSFDEVLVSGVAWRSSAEPFAFSGQA